jgi:hypothetical protein
MSSKKRFRSVKKRPLQPGLRNPAGLRKTQRQPMDGALLAAASIVAAIRLRGQEITRSPKLVAVVNDSVLLARTVMAALERDQ